MTMTMNMTPTKTAERRKIDRFRNEPHPFPSSSFLAAPKPNSSASAQTLLLPSDDDVVVKTLRSSINEVRIINEGHMVSKLRASLQGSFPYNSFHLPQPQQGCKAVERVVTTQLKHLRLADLDLPLEKFSMDAGLLTNECVLESVLVTWNYYATRPGPPLQPTGIPKKTCWNELILIFPADPNPNGYSQEFFQQAIARLLRHSSMSLFCKLSIRGSFQTPFLLEPHLIKALRHAVETTIPNLALFGLSYVGQTHNKEDSMLNTLLLPHLRCLHLSRCHLCAADILALEQWLMREGQCRLTELHMMRNVLIFLPSNDVIFTRLLPICLRANSSMEHLVLVPGNGSLTRRSSGVDNNIHSSTENDACFRDRSGGMASLCAGGGTHRLRSLQLPRDNDDDDDDDVLRREDDDDDDNVYQEFLYQILDQCPSLGKLTLYGDSKPLAESSLRLMAKNRAGRSLFVGSTATDATTITMERSPPPPKNTLPSSLPEIASALWPIILERTATRSITHHDQTMNTMMEDDNDDEYRLDTLHWLIQNALPQVLCANHTPSIIRAEVKAI